MSTHNELQQAREQITEMQKLATRKGFIEAYYAELPNHETYKEAYYAVEDKYEEYFKKTKYASYDSFRKILVKYVNRKRK